MQSFWLCYCMTLNMTTVMRRSICFNLCWGRTRKGEEGKVTNELFAVHLVVLIGRFSKKIARKFLVKKLMKGSSITLNTSQDRSRSHGEQTTTGESICISEMTWWLDWKVVHQRPRIHRNYKWKFSEKGSRKKCREASLIWRIRYGVIPIPLHKSVIHFYPTKFGRRVLLNW